MGMKKIYAIRHCQAEGQEPHAPLTNEGLKQAEILREWLKDESIQRIVSSPFKRAVQTVEPLSRQLNMPIEKDQRLEERVLSTKYYFDWQEKLERTFADMDLAFEGGESSRQAMERGVKVVEDIFSRKEKGTVLVTHGGLMSLLLSYYTGDFGFEGWKNLRNPDVYVLTRLGSKTFVERMDLGTENISE